MGPIKKLKRFYATWPIRGFRTIEGWLSDKEALTLYKIARNLPPDANVLEIGSWQGKSTYCLAKGLRSGKIHALDPFNTSGETGSDQLYAEEAGKLKLSLIDTFRTNLRECGLLEKVLIHQGYSNQFVGCFAELDLLFIDGDHSIEGCTYDYIHFGGSVRTGGFLAFHDYQPNRHDLGPTHVVDRMVAKSPLWARSITADSLVVFRRNAREFQTA